MKRTRFTKKEKSYIANIITNVDYADEDDKKHCKMHDKICEKMMGW